jgi:hypothetical protein
MSQPKIHSTYSFEPRLQILHEQMNPVLKTLFNLAKADQVFLSCWNDEYSQVYNQDIGFFHDKDLDGNQLKKCFKTLASEAIYVANARLHTLIQDIQFFSNSEKNENLFLLPLIDSNNSRFGLVGLSISSSDDFDFDQVIHQIETIGQHISDIYSNFSVKSLPTPSSKINFDHLPVSFFNFSINRDAELLDCHFSKYLIREHPAFKNFSGNSLEILEPLLQMDVSSVAKLLLRSNNDQFIEYAYPFIVDEHNKQYFQVKMHVSLAENGVYHCLVLVRNISLNRAYTNVLDQILFDISHVMRRPVVSMKGLTNLIDLDQFDKTELYEIAGKVKVVSDEMEDYIKAMFKIYEAKQEDIYYF